MDLINFTGKDIVRTFKMNWALLLLLASCCITWSTAEHSTSSAEPRKLKYLINPPVFAEVIGRRGDNVTLPCILQSKPNFYKVKWTKLQPGHVGPENIIMISNSHAFKPYGHLGLRASLRNAHSLDASLTVTNLELGDSGAYRCELINGIEDESVQITLRVEGVVFPYQSKNGRYKLTFHEARAVCAEQDGILATYDQLYRAWTEGLDWCNAGWLADGTVQYPILYPRPVCGGGPLPGIRSYGPKNKQRDQFDAFCFTSQMSGVVYYISGAFSFQQATHACQRQSAELALVGQLYAAWYFHNYDQCDGGWLRDGSVRFPIRNPRERCGSTYEAGCMGTTREWK
uniref:Hyaluronan and proteoglycan link protein 2 n=1 Tax=Cynoglossus semilaevis TaxID=244447 RepID=A0A3P8VNL1_CYNSE